jgi:hypothetical protein
MLLVNKKDVHEVTTAQKRDMNAISSSPMARWPLLYLLGGFETFGRSTRFALIKIRLSESEQIVDEKGEGTKSASVQ